MAQLYKVHGGDQAFCPFARAYCYTDCAWLIPVFEEDEEIAFYTCCMNNNLTAALMTVEQLEHKEERKNQEDEMMSTTYKERMKNEYNELCERIKKLDQMLFDWWTETLDFTPTCPPYLLEEQLEVMKKYRDILEARNYLEKAWHDAD